MKLIEKIKHFKLRYLLYIGPLYYLYIIVTFIVYAVSYHYNQKGCNATSPNGNKGGISLVNTLIVVAVITYAYLVNLFIRKKINKIWSYILPLIIIGGVAIITFIFIIILAFYACPATRSQTW